METPKSKSHDEIMQAVSAFICVGRGHRVRGNIDDAQCFEMIVIALVWAANALDPKEDEELSRFESLLHQSISIEDQVWESMRHA